MISQSDYKLLSKVFSVTLGSMVGEMIQRDQMYCTPGRSIFDNAFVRDIFDVSKLFGLNIGLISIDQEKAFDRVEHGFLWKT